ncbi:MAG: 4'-phosphopantetheinyl transferase superfamily protein [Firmicutes bacterium]|nr:4'-phosphopantetheinyl transferase superfamily protein [Bacillota bacterium]
MELYLIDEYRNEYPDLRGRELTNALLTDLFRELGVPEPVIVRSSKGKPSLEDGSFQFSVSHSDNLFACAVDDSPVGLDIQKVRKLDTGAIARRFFTAEEADWISREGPPAFFRLWTRKEALSKLRGCELAEVVGENVMNREDIFFKEINLGNGMLCCICRAEEVTNEVSVSHRE